MKKRSLFLLLVILTFSSINLSAQQNSSSETTVQFPKEVICRSLEHLNAEIASAEKKQRSFDIGRRMAFGTGAAGFLLSGASWYLGEREYETYRAATLTVDSEASHARLVLYSGLQIGGLIAGAVGTIIGLILP